MNTKQVVRNNMLLRKIAEYFAKNPSKKTVVVKASLGESKVYWKAVRESRTTFRIVEVNTTTDSYIFEIATPAAPAEPKEPILLQPKKTKTIKVTLPVD